MRDEYEGLTGSTSISVRLAAVEEIVGEVSKMQGTIYLHLVRVEGMLEDLINANNKREAKDK